MDATKDKFAAGEQGLGYIYQVRFALAHLMGQEESQTLFLEADDDVKVVDVDGQSTLISLKHKKVGETVGTLSVDFWKSVRIWLSRYIRDGKLACDHSYCMATTARVGQKSELRFFLPGSVKPTGFENNLLTELDGSASELSGEIRTTLKALSATERQDFFSRIVIADESPRIPNLEAEITRQMKAVRQKYRDDIRERLEGWWWSQAIAHLEGTRGAISGYEVWDKVAAYSEEYRDDNLPITFGDSLPPEGVDADKDTRQFVQQLRAIGMPTYSLELAILDFHRAFSQRSHWARTEVLLDDELGKFERKLVGEWNRVRAHKKITPTASEQELEEVGRALYEWAELKCQTQIRARVTEEFVRRGTFHILANRSPEPAVYWHPKFAERLKAALEAAQ
ncbi:MULTISPECIES: ABC-three component system protein [Ralstonia]|uniref:ABC-three component system protein n=1 Tax=Ralstonia TaxID=48736 RepID=UPI000C7A4EEF|nr:MULTISPECIES: ABC-three component system protein [Ralstonia]PLT18962.1 hypothetical protein CXP34_02940 [Ralstonia mannitolilytica]